MNEEGTRHHVNWKTIIAGGVMTIFTSAAGFISSHWGGVTVEQAAKDKAELTATIKSSAEAAAAKVEDTMRKYVDGKFESATIYQPAMKKRKSTRGE